MAATAAAAASRSRGAAGAGWAEGASAAVAVARSGPGLDPPVGGGEERHTRGLKLCPLRVLTMPRPEKGMRWREWDEEEVFFAKEEKGFEMKMKGGGGGNGLR